MANDTQATDSPKQWRVHGHSRRPADGAHYVGYCEAPRRVDAIVYARQTCRYPDMIFVAVELLAARGNSDTR